MKKKKKETVLQVHLQFKFDQNINAGDLSSCERTAAHYSLLFTTFFRILFFWINQ